VAHLRFDLTKPIPGVPEADVMLEGPNPVSPITINSSGIYSSNGDQTWLVGGVLEAVFDVRDAGQTTRPVVMRWKGKEIARAAVGFAAIE
jgi:hypothetical protein